MLRVAFSHIYKQLALFRFLCEFISASFVDTSTCFMMIAGAVVLCLGLVQFIEEPKGHMHEILTDGTVQMIEVN